MPDSHRISPSETMHPYRNRAKLQLVIKGGFSRKLGKRFIVFKVDAVESVEPTFGPNPQKAMRR